ncbi:nucleotidyltransferase family protein [Streptomyces sp. NPDC060035]|uniref:nucleotidyltransferase domain-containing protein n=1 Tax=Streptomyces sp. NPDC060035 TaxID=3347044 RepID=UPI0036CB4002
MDTSEAPLQRQETELLLLLADLQLSAERVELCRKLLTDSGPRLDWGFFVDQAARHRLLPLVARNILRHGLHRVAQGPSPIPYHWLYIFVYYGNRDRNRILAGEFGKVIRGLNASGLAYAIRKGPVLGEHLYGDVGLRPVSDLDVIVEREHADAAGSVLSDLGYIQGKLSADGERIEPFTRRTKVFWQLNVPIELPYQKISGHDGIESFIVDICSDIFQTRPNGARLTGGLLARRSTVPLCGEQGSALAPEDQFIDLCVNLHMEATSLYYVTEGGDMEVLKFLDVSLGCRRISADSQWPTVRKRAEELGVVESVYYALHHTELLYPASVPAAELEALRPDDCGYLDEYGQFEGKAERWQQPFLQRLFDARRVDEVRHTNVIPRN